MGKIKSKKVSDFTLEGRFLNFILEDGYKPKYLRIASAEGEYWIKPCKELRQQGIQLTPGDWVQVLGERKLDLKTGKLKLKAAQVTRTIPHAPENAASPKVVPSKKKANILVCQKSSCMKRGGTAVCQALQATLSDRGLENEVAIKGTGCLKQCKAGPNIVMPDKTRYSRIQAAEIPEVIDKHFTASCKNAPEAELEPVSLNTANNLVSAN
ncbi:(2Fe-2S) ferredoxin domain-containing protein [Gloeocapsopsis dulcis]|uniref:(Fe-S)-binding protein n=1 Tax=Gloeocapsopsis dulcis AAB1 = 1H9 TaxID=1433147 RepID=A0A6N8FQ04_9CHRO|nr:(2Fe-2S) ferredoxin domain-containing protein [Gloeocapsopsis dulcis]MUL35323.1 (Fe-S)-binding protein [Gloeocapsopsis dulcis AAB1 = 1H9]WNN90475.1 (2Fe-2S) ferredoxin domain-containing protein [Gloeocapsopsis dulcis]